ncbi:protein phosphatase 2C 70 isoform X2 [Andrographis paniculata]|uniref:protein phosphatase 2C 70 isoform X2 n=1 Tax=Andrographis paniculata TaxID=175694 RepID=UPI0021E7C7F5|nr:protein phosphatase 2C 70 isoform X2 [Andrographis paniculata]
MEEPMRLATNGLLFSSSLLLGIAAAGLMILLIVILILIACKFRPWRRLLSSPPTRRRYPAASIKDDDDIERPLVHGEQGIPETPNVSSSSNTAEEGLSSMHFVPAEPKQRLHPAASHLSQSNRFYPLLLISFSANVDKAKTILPRFLGQFAGEQIQNKKEDTPYSRKYGSDKDSSKDMAPNYSASQGCTLMLEVISGPCSGIRYSIQSTETSKLPVTIGRVSPGDLILKESEVSGKHAMINWNSNKSKWELVDMGSLNGTILNGQSICISQSESRHWSNPVELSSGDVITLGTSSKILVHITTTQKECNVPFGIGIASDPMAMRRGGKKLPMEDVHYYHWPLPGMDQFGLFGICDGHGGADAATSVSKIMPEVITGILSDISRREEVLAKCNASDILKEAFYETESRISHYYEGCTATVLLIWTDDEENCFVQCANVGDSACVVNVDGRQVKMTEDHRITSYSERLRMQALGAPLKDRETRICGINLARMLGDKFLKERDARFSSEPYVSDVMRIDRSCKGFAIIASDGFWDVVNTRKAAQLVHQALERHATEKENPAEKIAKVLLNEAQTQRTKDNTSIIFLDFSTPRMHLNSCKPDHP